MRYRVEIDREPRAEFADWEDALRFAKAAAADDEEKTVQVIETGEREELILSTRHGKLAISGAYSYTLPEERAEAREAARRRRARHQADRPIDTPAAGPVYYVKEDNILYPMADGILTPADQAELAAAFDQVEAEEMGEGTHERYHQLAHEWAG